MLPTPFPWAETEPKAPGRPAQRSLRGAPARSRYSRGGSLGRLTCDFRSCHLDWREGPVPYFSDAVTGLPADRIGALAFENRIRVDELTTRTASLQTAFMELSDLAADRSCTCRARREAPRRVNVPHGGHFPSWRHTPGAGPRDSTTRSATATTRAVLTPAWAVPAATVPGAGRRGAGRHTSRRLRRGRARGAVDQRPGGPVGRRG